MLRLVTHGCEKPAFLMICDNIECAVTTSAEAITSELNPVSLMQQEGSFLEQCKKLGWFLSMRISLCPAHFRLIQEQAAQRRALVTPQGTPAQTGARASASFSAE